MLACELIGGKEAEASNACLHRIIQDAIHDGSNGVVSTSSMSVTV